MKVFSLTPLALFVHSSLAFPSFFPRHSQPHHATLTPNPPDGHWVDTWTAMPQLTEFTNLPPPPFNDTNLVFYNATIRQTLHVTTPASQIRVQISNAFGLVDLPITSMTIARPIAPTGQNLTGSSLINTTTVQHIAFSENKSITIAPGALAVSDPLDFPVKANEVLSVSIYQATGQASQYITSHPGSRTESYISFGDYTTASNMSDPSTQSVFHWYFISAVQAWQPPSHSSFVALGDSITDGRGSDNNGNNRWTDLLFSRMQSQGISNIAVLNQAAGGNRVLYDGLGPNLLSRIDRDVLARPNVKSALIFEGVNDIGSADATPYNQTLTGDRLIQAYEQIITRLHSHDIAVFGATITPFGCANETLQPYSDPQREKTRQKVNAWIRSSGKFGAVVDFDAVLRDPKNTTRLREDFNSGDCLHPNVAGYQALADGFPLEVFHQYENGVDEFW